MRRADEEDNEEVEEEEEKEEEVHILRDAKMGMGKS